MFIVISYISFKSSGYSLFYYDVFDYEFYGVNRCDLVIVINLKIGISVFLLDGFLF